MNQDFLKFLAEKGYLPPIVSNVVDKVTPIPGAVRAAKETLEAIEKHPIGKAFIKGFTANPQNYSPPEIKSNEDLAESFGSFASQGTPAGGVDDVLKVAGAALPAISGGIKTVSTKADDVAREIPKFEDLQNLTTSVIQKLRGSRSVTPQHIETLMGMPGVKEAEKKTLSKVLEKYKGNEKVFYRGEGGTNQFQGKSDYIKGKMFATDFDRAKAFGEVSKYQLKPDAKVLEVDAVGKSLDELAKELKVSLNDFLNAQKLREILSSRGYDAVITRQRRGINGQILPESPVDTDLIELTDNVLLPRSATQTKIPVKQFAEDVEKELLPLEKYSIVDDIQGEGNYEHVTLPEELRGHVGKYDEHIYGSPIKTSAGQVHFGNRGDTGNYFAHSRVEDLPLLDEMGQLPNNTLTTGNTRRVIEIQSDLFQRGRLDKEMRTGAPLNQGVLPERWAELKRRRQQIETAENPENYADELSQINQEIDAIENQVRPEAVAFKKQREAELSKLKPYENTWHERVIREEVKKAAQDGKTKLQFPTGETAMKIEGLGRAETWTYKNNVGDVGLGQLTPDKIKPNQIVYSENQGHFIVTKDLGNGKFRAVPARPLEMENDQEIYKMAWDRGYIDRNTGEWNFEAARADKSIMQRYDDRYGENFDASGKLDTSNPIYKFYESEVGKYLGKKYDAKRIKDPQGVEWWELDIKPEQGKAPIEAFGVAPLLMQPKKEEEKNSYPLPPIY